ncbi:MAG TPA: D-tyrosyl-tRNA(Tyr) deacylase [Flavobacteriales bacterium]|nr:D-tyrosyl-tRNA(Tyr) deacylase [Flavobacteriales bacterium]
MRLVVQRVKEASVIVKGKIVGSIGDGLIVFLGIEDLDTHEDIIWLSNKIVKMRIFDDEQGLMNLSVQDINGEILVISQFTLHASTKKGNRPSFIKAAKPEIAKPLYNGFISQLQSDLGKQIQSGRFGAMMKVKLTNDGPVTIIIDSQHKE